MTIHNWHCRKTLLLLLLPQIFGPSYGPVLCVHETPSSLFVLHSSITATYWYEILSEVEFTFLYGNGLKAQMTLQKILDPKLQSSKRCRVLQRRKGNRLLMFVTTKKHWLAKPHFRRFFLLSYAAFKMFPISLLFIHFTEWYFDLITLWKSGHNIIKVS